MSERDVLNPAKIEPARGESFCTSLPANSTSCLGLRAVEARDEIHRGNPPPPGSDGGVSG